LRGIPSLLVAKGVAVARWSRVSNETGDEDEERFPASLLEAAFEGDPAAQEELWRRTLEAAVRLAEIIAQKNGIPRPDVEDAVQNAMLSLYSLPPERLRDINNWEAFLYRVVKNKMIDWLRRRITHDKHEGTSLDEEVGNDEDGEGFTILSFVSAEGPDPSEEMGLRDLIEAVEREVLAGLSEEKRRVFRLYLQGYKYREIAERTEVPENTVSVWIYRTKKECRRWWDSQRGPDGRKAQS
jgi:RNA polymerase sigma-70 factor (ECF subfamily)